MRNLYCDNQGTNTYLVYDVMEDDNLDSLSLGMLTNNSIPGLTETVYTQMNNQKYIKYNISSKISARQFLQGEVTKNRLLGVFASIANAYASAEDYMILPESLLLDLDYIFVDVSTNDAVMICMPLMNLKNESVDLKDFFRGIMFNTKFAQREECDYVARIINYLNGSPVFALEQFKKVLAECNENDKTSKPTTGNQEIAATQVVKKKPVSTSDVTQQAQSAAVSNTAVPSQPAVPKSSVSQPVVPQPVEGAMIQPVVNPGSSRPIPHKMQKSVSPASGTASASQSQDQQNDISLFYLLQHYNKDNAAAYKAQKAAKKEMKATDSKPAASKKQEVSVKNESLGFAIPGQAMMPVNSASQSIASQQPMVAAQPQVVSKPANFGNTTVLNVPQSNATTVLDASAIPGMGPVTKPYLIRKKNNETILIDKNEYRLGKERSFVDYFIGDNTAVSRSHACIVYHDNEYFVMDTNSTNHTFVNDIMLQSNVETKLESGTKIRLADEEFEFKMM